VYRNRHSFIAENKSVYIDQDYSLIDNNRKVYEQSQQFNTFGIAGTRNKNKTK